MKARLNYARVAPGLYDAMDALDQYLSRCALEESLLHLVRLRASQINGCAYCLDMHWKDLRALGEAEQRLYSLDAWRECPYYSERERAALAWTEALTLITEGHAPDAVYESARAQLSERELADLSLAVAAINAWNRLSIGARAVPGNYQPAQTANMQMAAASASAAAAVNPAVTSHAPAAADAV
jgi:AhpD family alkylhydroperoxidase